LLLDNIIFEEENKKLISKVIDELEHGEKNFGNVDQKQYQIDIIPLRNQFNQIDSYLILTDDKNRNQDEKNAQKGGKSRKNFLLEIEKSCANLIEHYSLQDNYSPQDLMNFLKEKSIEYKISTQLDVSSYLRIVKLFTHAFLFTKLDNGRTIQRFICCRILPY
jgi:hypothetical protein